MSESVTVTAAPDAVTAIEVSVVPEVSNETNSVGQIKTEVAGDAASESASSAAPQSVSEEKPKLVLAPLPKKSPWDETKTTAVKPLDLSKMAVKSKNVTSAGKFRSKGTPSLTGKEKWVPLAVDIVVKDKIPDANSTANGTRGKKLKNKAKKEKPKNLKKTKSKEVTKGKKDGEPEKKLTKKHENSANKDSKPVSINGTSDNSANGKAPKSEVVENGSGKAERTLQAESSSEAEAAAVQVDEKDEGKKSERQQLRFTAQSKPFFPKGSSNHHVNHHHNHHYQQKSQRNRPYTPVMYQQNYTPSYVLVNEIVRQIQYYFSIENLSKDMFLRSQMNAQGYVPLALISRFHRMLNLSYGDVGLILAALRELKNFPESNVNIAKLTMPFENVEGNPLFQYALSSTVWNAESITDPKPYEIAELAGDELELFKIEPINPIIDYSNQFYRPHSSHKHEHRNKHTTHDENEEPQLEQPDQEQQEQEKPADDKKQNENEISVQ